MITPLYAFRFLSMVLKIKPLILLLLSVSVATSLR